MRAVAQCDRVGIARAEYFPRFVLVGSFGAQSSDGGGVLSGNSSFLDLFTLGGLVYTFGGRLFWPVLNYGRIRNNVRVEDARFQQTLVTYQNTVLKAAQEVEDNVAGFLREQESTAFGENAVVAARDSVHIALVQYREGAVDYQRVLDTQRVLLQTEQSLARTRSAVATNLIALYKALGGGWELRDGQPVVADRNRIEMQKRTNWGGYFSQPPVGPQKPATAPTRR
jgi:outer membrane protein TolC